MEAYKHKIVLRRHQSLSLAIAVNTADGPTVETLSEPYIENSIQAEEIFLDRMSIEGWTLVTSSQLNDTTMYIFRKRIDG